MVQLTLPADLTSSDAARIAGFVRSLAFDDLTDSPPASVGTANDSRRTDGN